MSTRQPLLDRTIPPVQRQTRPADAQSIPLDPERILAKHARTSFNMATRFLPRDRRQATTLLYAFFRTLDDSVDEIADGSQRSGVRETLIQWRAWAHDPCASTQIPELADAIDEILEQYGVPRYLLADFIEGLISDLDHQEIRDREDLDRYCYQVASTVGLIMCRVLGASQPEALQAAADLGAAMQMTNILRDIGEDLAIGRVYIPTSTLQRYSLDIDALKRLEGSPREARIALEPMMRSEIARNRAMYRQALPGVWLLPRDSRMAILLAARLYRHILTIVEKNGYDSINYRAATSRWDKLRELSTCAVLARLWRHDDGEQKHAA